MILQTRIPERVRLLRGWRRAPVQPAGLRGDRILRRRGDHRRAPGAGRRRGRAVAVSVPFVNGGAGYLSPGDMVNVYQVIPGEVQGGIDPHTQLLLTNVRVLDVQQQVAALNSTTAAAQAGVASRPAATTADMTVL